MRKLGLWIFVILVATSLFASTGLAKSKKKAKDTIRLKDLETLYMISQDLDADTAIFIKPDQNCYCSCRDNLWSCTDLTCKAHYQSCENAQEPESRASLTRQSKETEFTQTATASEPPARRRVSSFAP